MRPIPEYTIVIPSTALRAIKCGAYNSKDQSLLVSSSWGPTRLLRIAPDFVAPGVDVKGIYPTGYGTMTGTSVAAAITAGIAALLFEWGIVNGNKPAMDSDLIRSYISNVQLFPEQTAIQNVLLLPSYNAIDIPYPTLWGTYPPKIPESEVKKLPLPTGQIVLPEPVVPSLITVHEGRPEDSSASNYTVGFKDYIKNVASCEIYSTWPREAIKANVFAILSFTLSRVYTEWYRGKGYGFTITNSTAFDQAFSFGRNIFDEISEVVDEIFTTYISRPDLVQPLFTQYCDGKRVKRAGWLSQWGSKELADQGLNALQILKTYYGSDIVLKQAKKVEGIPLSFTNVLKIGSTGDAVKTIQQQLNTISNNYPLIKKVVVDGVYGASTAEAVRTFQQIFDLPETGEVNFPTWYSISNIFVAISKLA